MAGDGSARFPSTMRLKTKREIIRAFRKGTAWKGSCFSLHVFVRTDAAIPADTHSTCPLKARLGMIVPKSVGTAVERNRVKRRIREIFRKMGATLPPVDIVMRVDPACRTVPDEDIAQAFAGAVSQALSGATKER